MSEKYIDSNLYAASGYALAGRYSLVAVGPKGSIGGSTGSPPDGAGGDGVRLSPGLSGRYALSNSGAIVGGVGAYYNAKVEGKASGAGGVGVYWRTAGEITNSTGTITGGAGGLGGNLTYAAGGAGGVGVQLASGGTIKNAGVIAGGGGGAANQGGYQYSGAGGRGGVGIVAVGATTIQNSGAVDGGNGNDSYFQVNGGAGGDGAAAIVLKGAGTLTNSGTISGGSGGGGLYGPGGVGGHGVDVDATATVVNRGVIRGGAGGEDDEIMAGISADSGPGVDLAAAGSVVNGHDGKIIGGSNGVYNGDAVVASGSGATITNFGAIVGYGAYRGAYGGFEAGLAVSLEAASDRLVAEAGSVVSGQIAGGGGTLELAGGRGAISGIGGAAATTSGAEAMSFYGFGAYVIDRGGAWSISGDNTLAAGQSLTGTSGVTLEGSLQVASGASVTDVAAAAGSTLGVAGTATFDETNRLSGTLSGGGVLFERGAGILVQSGDAAGFSGTAVISGGTIKLVNSTDLGSAEIRYDTASSTLELDTAAAPGAGKVFGEVLLNFDKTGEYLDLAGQAFVSGAHAVRLTGDILKVADGAWSAEFRLSGSTASSFARSYAVTSDGHGGVLIEAIGATSPAAGTQPFAGGAAVLAHAMATFRDIGAQPSGSGWTHVAAGGTAIFAATDPERGRD